MKTRLFYAYDVLGDNYFEQNMPDSGKVYLLRAIKIGLLSYHPVLNIRAEYLRSDLLLKQGDIHNSIIHAKKGLDLSIIANDYRLLQSGYSTLYKLYKSINNNKASLLYFEKFIQIKDSLVGHKTFRNLEALHNTNKILENETRISELKREYFNQQLNYQKKIYLVILIIFGIIILAVYLFFESKNRHIINVQKSIELEHRLLLSQMNQHFTFNALSSIQTFLLKTGQSTKAAYFLAKFAKLMRQILNQSNTPLISIEEEIQTLTNYLTLQKLRYKNTFSYQFSIDNSINSETVQIPPMLMQPIIENAIEHGKIHTLKDGEVDIFITSKNDLLQITIKDNGVGRSVSQSKIAKNHKSLAMSIIKERLAALRKKYSKNIKMIILDPKEGGMEVLLYLPLIINEI